DACRISERKLDVKILREFRVMDLTIGHFMPNGCLNIAQQESVHERATKRQRPYAYDHSADHHGAAPLVSPNISPCKYCQHVNLCYLKSHRFNYLHALYFPDRVTRKNNSHNEHRVCLVGEDHGVKRKRVNRLHTEFFNYVCHVIDRKSTRLNSSHVKISYAV